MPIVGVTPSPCSVTARTGGAGVVIPENHTDGLISEWLFDDGSGDTITDSVGSNDVDMSAVTSQSFTHESWGIRMSGGSFVTGRIDTGSTFVALVRMPYQQTGGFIMSGGTASNQGILQGQTYSSGNYHIGGGFGVHTPKITTAGAADGWENNGGGLVLMFMEPTSTIDTAWCLGGRAQASNTSNRCAQLDVVWAALYDDVLTDGERTTIYEYAAYIARSRSVYLRCIDCPTQRDAILLTGESTAEGRSLISNLPTGEQNQVFDNVWISVQSGSNNTPLVYPPPVFDLGVNHTAQNASLWFGPELGYAQKAETAASDLVIIKSADGSTQIASPLVSGGTDPANHLTWHPGGTASTLFNDLLANFYYTEQYWREQGVGLVFRGYHMDIGLNDAQNVDFASSAAVYQGYLQDFYDALVDYTNVSGFRVFMTLAHYNSSDSTKAAIANVRDGQEAFITALGSNGVLYNIDALDYYDTTHTHASIDFGEPGYDFLIDGTTPTQSALEQIVVLAQSLDGDGETVGFYDPSDRTTLWQDTAKTIQADAVGDPVRVIECAAGVGSDLIAISDAARCLLQQTAGGLWYIFSDTTLNPVYTSTPLMDFGTEYVGSVGVEAQTDNRIWAMSSANTNAIRLSNAGRTVNIHNVNVIINTDGEDLKNPSVLTVDYQSNTAVTASVDGGAPYGPVDPVDMAPTQGLGLFSARNNVAQSNYNGRFFGGFFTTGSMTAGQLVAMERGLESRSGATLSF